MTLQSGGQNAVSIEKNTAHSRYPLLDQLEIIAEAIGGLLVSMKPSSEMANRVLNWKMMDQLEIIAEAIGGLLEGKSSFSQSELRSLAHIRQMTRMHKTKSGE